MSILSRRETLKARGFIVFASFFFKGLMAKTADREYDGPKKAWFKRYPFRYIEPVDTLPKAWRLNGQLVMLSA